MEHFPLLIDRLKEQVQNQALEALLKNKQDNKIRGTCEIATGTGKTFIAFKLILELKPSSVLFLAETTLRWDNILADAEFFKKCYDVHPFEMTNASFACYQSAYEWKNRSFDLVVADEIHDSLSPKYFEFYRNNNYNHLLGLSATIDNQSKYEDSDGNEYTKIDMLNSIAPIVFRYTLQDGINNNTSRKLNVIVIKHHLDAVNKSIAVNYKDKKTGQPRTFYQTEKEMYDYYNQKFYQTLYNKNRNEFLFRFFLNKRNSILYTAPSKMEVVKELLKYLNRTIIFGNDIASISSLVPTVSSKNKALVNNKIIYDFNTHKIDVIGSFKMLKQGINLKDLDNVIMHSYYGVQKDFIQRVGRLRQASKDGFVFIILTMNSQEIVWFNRMIAPLNAGIIWCENVNDALDVWSDSIKRQL